MASGASRRAAEERKEFPPLHLIASLSTVIPAERHKRPGAGEVATASC